MHCISLSALLAVVVGVYALPQHLDGNRNSKPAAPAIPAHVFAETPKFVKPLSLEEAKAKFNTTTASPSSSKAAPKIESLKAAAAPAAAINSPCAAPRTRTEWDSMDDSSRQSFINAIKCLMGKPASGTFQGAQSRYEDMVSLHQSMTNVIHGNDIFLFWHRYACYLRNGENHLN